MTRSSRTERGLTFVELVATAAIMMILAAAIMPVARMTHKRQREIELRRALREVRTAIDLYHYDATQGGKIGGMDIKLGSEGYPPDLETLVKGVNQVGAVNKKLKYLRRIPFDPMTGTQEWGLRCYRDDADSTSWCGDDVWDVYTKGEGTALDGSLYAEW
jgi:general secretion pathway protein G